MVVTEALARGLPVVAAEVGGVPEALGHGADGTRPGVLVPPDDPAALGAALRAWLTDADLRERAGNDREHPGENRASAGLLGDVVPPGMGHGGGEQKRQREKGHGRAVAGFKGYGKSRARRITAAYRRS